MFVDESMPRTSKYRDFVVGRGMSSGRFSRGISHTLWDPQTKADLVHEFCTSIVRTLQNDRVWFEFL
jgi:hypothetical protein